MSTIREHLEAVLAWVENELSGETTAPWEWFVYMKLREDVKQVLAGVDPLDGYPGPLLKLVEEGRERGRS